MPIDPKVLQVIEKVKGTIVRFLPLSHNDSPDTLGRYPEHMQVRALPERRYLKTSRILAVFIFLNLGVMMAFAGYFGYLAERVEISVDTKRFAMFFFIDTDQKRLRPTEHAERIVSAYPLFEEAMLREYILNRYTIVWDNTEQARLWERGSLISALSSRKMVYEPFVASSQTDLNEFRAQGFIRDAHLYSLENIGGNMWTGVVETFELPVPDYANPLCNECKGNSQECLQCKIAAAEKFQESRREESESTRPTRRRYQVFVRMNYLGQQSILNPLGLVVQRYYELPLAVDGDDFWDTPIALKPHL